MHQLITAGRLDARRAGAIWVIDADKLADFEASRRPHVRPMSELVARGMVDLVGQHLGEVPGQDWEALAHRERSRLRRSWEQLVASDRPASLLRVWLPNRCRTERFSYNGDPQEVYDDPRLQPGGAAHPLLGLSGGSLVEPHVADHDREDVIWDLLLVPSRDGDVLLRAEPVVRVDLGACLADVADLGGTRNDKVVADVLSRGAVR